MIGIGGLGLNVSQPKSGSPPFSPADLGSGLAIWLRADLGLTMGTGVSAWADQSGNGRNYSQATGSRQPTLGTAINGKETLHFTAAATQFLTRTGAYAFTAAHVFIVAKIVADPPPGIKDGLWRFGTGAASHYPLSTGTLYEEFGTNTRRDAIAKAISLTTDHCYEVITTATEYTIKLNGTQIYTSGTNTVAWDNPTLIGSSQAQTGLLDGDVAEMILADHKLTTERTSLAAYFLTRYGITI